MLAPQMENTAQGHTALSLHLSVLFLVRETQSANRVESNKARAYFWHVHLYSWKMPLVCIVLCYSCHRNIRPANQYPISNIQQSTINQLLYLISATRCNGGMILFYFFLLCILPHVHSKLLDSGSHHCLCLCLCHISLWVHLPLYFFFFLS